MEYTELYYLGGDEFYQELTHEEIRDLIPESFMEFDNKEENLKRIVIKGKLINKPTHSSD